MWVVIGVVVVVVVVLMMYGNVKTAQIHSEISQDPLARQVLDPIERWGKYDGSPEQERKASEALCILESNLRPASIRTRSLYQKALKLNLYIPLAASYAYARGEYLEGAGVPLDGINSPEARQKIAAMRMFFPALYNVANADLPPRMAEAALCITSNLLDNFLNTGY